MHRMYGVLTTYLDLYVGLYTAYCTNMKQYIVGVANMKLYCGPGNNTFQSVIYYTCNLQWPIDRKRHQCSLWLIDVYVSKEKMLLLLLSLLLIIYYLLLNNIYA